MKKMRKVLSWVLVMVMLLSNTTYVSASSATFSETDVVTTEVSEEAVSEAVSEEVSEEAVSETVSEEEVSEETVSEVASEERVSEETSEEDGTENVSEEISEENSFEEAVSEEKSEEASEESSEENLFDAELYGVEAEDDDTIMYSGTDAGLNWQITTEGVLTIAGENTANETPQKKWLEHKADIKAAVVTAKGMTTMEGWFSGCEQMLTADLSQADTSKVTDMSWMFNSCSSLTELDVRGFDTSKVTTMSFMFTNCNKLSQLDLRGFNTSKVTNMGWMFYGCNGLEELNLSGFNTSKVMNMGVMFAYCESLKRLDVSNFDTSKVTDMSQMFYMCNSLEELDVSGFDTSKVTDMSLMFCVGSNLKKLDVSGFDTSKVMNMRCMFSGCYSLEELDVSGFNTSKVTDMSFMFYGCNGLEELDVSGFNTSKVTNMSKMFYECVGLEELDISGINTSKVTSMTEMFLGCSRLTKLDLSGFDVANAGQSVDAMLSNCTSLTYLETMPNVTVDVLLPVTMYDDEYGTHTSIPLNSDSMCLHTLCTVTFDSDDGSEPEVMENVLTMHTVTTPAPVSNDKKVFAGWFTGKNGQGREFTDKTPVEQDICLYAHWIDGLRVNEVEPQTYTGKAIKPQIQVYDGDKLLKEKVDYTVSYKNNIKVNDASDAKTAPTIVVKGKGNYSGKETVTFSILAKDLQAEDVSYADVLKVANDKVQKPVPTIQYNGKTLKNKTDFTVSYPDVDNPEKADAYKAPGEYTILVTGTGNFTGELEIPFVITDAVLMSKTKIAAISAQPYTGSEIKPELRVTYKGTALELDKDYTVEYKNNVDVGKATAVVTGMGDYAGTKEVTFKITGISIAKATVNGIVDKTYNGQEQTQNVEVLLGGEKLDPANYTVSCSKNTDVGTATVLITGKGNYTGTVKKKFKITARDLSTDSTCMWSSQMEYAKGGTLNNVSVIVDGVALEEKKDYTLSYSNNKKVTKEGDTKLPTITIRGKGNYKGMIQKTYTIVAKDLSQALEPVKINVPDVAYSAKAGKYISKPVLTDSNGKKLVAGTDYEKKVVYTLADGTELNSKKDAPKAGTVITVTVNGKGNYTGTIAASYKITKAAFNSAKINVDAKAYTGQKIFLNESDITVKVGKTQLKYGKDFVIVEDSYKNNEQKGTASVTIKGVGNYGGEKTVKFKIVSKEFAWFWNLF